MSYRVDDNVRLVKNIVFLMQFLSVINMKTVIKNKICYNYVKFDFIKVYTSGKHIQFHNHFNND